MPVYRLLPADDVEITNGQFGDCTAICQAKWFFERDPLSLSEPRLRTDFLVFVWNSFLIFGALLILPRLLA